MYEYKDYYKISKKTERLIGARNLFLIQIVLGVLVFGIIYINYNSITRSSSSVNRLEVKKIDIKQTHPSSIKNLNNTLSYSGIFGEIKFKSITKGNNINQFYHKLYILINIDSQKVSRSRYLIDLLKKGYIDGYIANYLIRLDNKDFEDKVNDIKTLLMIFKNINISEIEYKDTSKDIETILLTKDYEKIEKILKEQEQDLFDSLNGSQVLTEPFMNYEGFKYLIEKLYIDKDNLYKTHIENVSNIFGINKNLIQAPILTEQIRALFTYRGRMKSIIASDLYLMVMSQSSYGIGGMKEGTARLLEVYMKEKHKDIYDKYFSHENGKSIFTRLTDTKDYRYQILYIGGLLKKIEETRNDSGHPINDKPGILMTIYNIGEKTPNPDPVIGGADILIDDKKYTFGSLAMLMYYYLEIYGPYIQEN